MKQKFYVGLDMGTASVGWAVTDDKYNIIKRHGKALWGVRLFKTANTAGRHIPQSFQVTTVTTP